MVMDSWAEPGTGIRARTLADRCEVHGARFMVWVNGEWACSRRGQRLDDGRGWCGVSLEPCQCGPRGEDATHPPCPRVQECYENWLISHNG